MATTQLAHPRQTAPQPRTLHRLSKEAGVPERALVLLVRRENIRGRSGRYDPATILELLARG